MTKTAPKGGLVTPSASWQMSLHYYYIVVESVLATKIFYFVKWKTLRNLNLLGISNSYFPITSSISRRTFGTSQAF